MRQSGIRFPRLRSQRDPRRVRFESRVSSMLGVSSTHFNKPFRFGHARSPLAYHRIRNPQTTIQRRIPQRRRSLVGGNRPDGESSSGTSCFGAGGNKHLRLDRDLRYVLPHATTLPAILKTIVDPLRDPRVGDEKQSPRRPRFATLEIESGSISSRNDSATFQSTSHSGQ